MPFYNLKDVGLADEEGRILTSHFRKVPSQASVAGNWVDLSMASGNPVPNYFASSPLEAAYLDGFRGVFYGDDVSPKQRIITTIGLMTPTAAMVGQYQLLDYLLYYPFIDGDSLDTQTMVNDQELTRYTDGKGVKAMLVAVAPTTGGGTLTFTYIDDQDVERTSPTISINTTAANIATLGTSQQAVASGGQVFLTLASGSMGIKKVLSVQMISASGGLFSLVLVKPLASVAIREINTVEEINYVRQNSAPPVIMDGAYLNFICNPAGSVAAGTLAGYLTTIWSKE